jgi:small-conductance mechanosensitive channel
MPLECVSRASRLRRLLRILAILGVIVTPSIGASQENPAGPAPQPAQPVTTMAAIERLGESATLTFSNRPIVVLRARVMGRLPAERAAVARRLLDGLVEDRLSGPIEVRTLESSRIIAVGNRSVIALTPLDVDDLAGETLDEVTARAVSTLQLALAEALEARAPWVIVRAVLLSLLAIGLAIALLLAIVRGHRIIAQRLVLAAERRIVRAGEGSLEVLRASRVFEFWRRAISLASILLGLFVAYSVLTFILRRFQYTRPWGESMRSFMLERISTLAIDMLHAIPALFTVALIFIVARFFVRLLQLFFKAIEVGNVQVDWLHPETAQPTRRLITALLWVFAAVMAYPYLPGSDTDAFKGASVFIGLVISLGSSGLVNQVMSSFMITYSRALRLGDFVRIGDVEGTVTHVGVLSTKIKTLRGEEVTLPNAVVVATNTTNYSRFADSEGVFTPTSVTIGYETPWRQVQSLLLAAADRTPGIRKSPAPRVLESELQEFGVKYTLLVGVEQLPRRGLTMSALHGNILDTFNEFGVQIMTPAYEGDPAEPKIVPKAKWYAEPAREPSRESGVGDRQSQSTV